jgi:hypothetical protein
MKMRSKLPALEGRRLTNEMIKHNNDFGGVTAIVYGSKGSGKTTLFLTLCQTVQCYNKNGDLEFETSIWRGGDEDYWTWLPYERTRVFIHRDDFNTVSFKCDEDLKEYDRSQLPQIIMYKNNKDLYSKLLRGGINVVYEPTTYTLTDRLKKMIQRRGVTGDDLFKNKTIDPIIWWFEFIDWLRVNKSIEHISVFIDEADQLLPVSPSGARWHLNLWFKDIMRALRKRNISLYMACHGYTDIDGRMKPKIMFRVYMKGSCTPSESLIFKTAPVTLPQGKYYIEKDAWGWAKFNKIDEQPRVLVVLKRNEDDDAINQQEEDDEDEERRIANINSQNSSSPKEPTKEIVVEEPNVVFPVGIDDLPVKIDRKPGEFTPVIDPGIVPEEFDIIDSDDEFTLKAPDTTTIKKPDNNIQVNDSKTMENGKRDNEQGLEERRWEDETDEKYTSPSLDDLLESGKDYLINLDKKINNKNIIIPKYDPTKDDLFE